MFCPSCNCLLQKISVTTNSGEKFEVDHCGRRGSSWFDPYEINRIPYHEVVRLAKITVLPKNPTKRNKHFACPRCHKKMQSFPSKTSPLGVSLIRCPICHGVFALPRNL